MQKYEQRFVIQKINLDMPGIEIVIGQDDFWINVG